MSRKSFLFAIGILLLLGSIGTVFVLLLSHEPAIYARTTPPPGDERKHRQIPADLGSPVQ
jgi:hypothetical protein